MESSSCTSKMRKRNEIVVAWETEKEKETRERFDLPGLTLDLFLVERTLQSVQGPSGGRYSDYSTVFSIDSSLKSESVMPLYLVPCCGIDLELHPVL
jgi:hypothetical protein